MLTAGLTDRWRELAEVHQRLYAGEAAPPGERRWYAALTGAANAELNVGLLLPDADASDAGALAAELGDLPAIAFTSQEVRPQARPVLVAAGFALAPTPEPLMVATAPPSPVVTPFVVGPATEDEVDAAVAVMAEAHHVALADAVATYLRPDWRPYGRLWAARDDGEVVSAVWLARHGDVLAVVSMMTPPRHQRRGAGRAVLAEALASSWDEGVDHALLLSTPAGRRLYESLGFVAVDEATTCFRGSSPEMLSALGQPG